MSLRAIALALSCCVFGCSGGCSGPTEGASRDRSERRDNNGTGEENEQEAAGEDTPGVAPTVRVIGVVDPHTRNVNVRVENHGTAPTNVGGNLLLQRRDGDAWEDVSARVQLRFDCRTEAPDCATLAPGAVWIPPDWTGMLGDAQCDCERCAPAPAGTYRFVARSCGGDQRAEGEAFVLGPG
jgi:hypothetical protein